MANSTVSSGGPASEERRIWLGNLDARLTEYQLLKIVQKCGTIDKFDMLFHKGGPLIGQSRGYAFVTFTTSEGATNALEKLNGTLIANRPIVVRLAKNVNYDDLDRPKPRIEIPALAVGNQGGRISKEEAIRAIEAKLKALEQSPADDFDLNTALPGGVPIIQRYNYNKDRDASSSGGPQRSGRSSYTKSGSRPYNRNQRPKRR